MSRPGSRPPPPHFRPPMGPEASPVLAVLSQDARAPPWQVCRPRGASPCTQLPACSAFAVTLAPCSPRGPSAPAGKELDLICPHVCSHSPGLAPGNSGGGVPAFPAAVRPFSRLLHACALLSELRFELSLFQFCSRSKNRGGVSLFSHG